MKAVQAALLIGGILFAAIENRPSNHPGLASTAQSDPQPDGSFKIHRDESYYRGANIDLKTPVFIDKGAVLCEPIASFAAYLDGHHAGGEPEGHRRVADLFVHPTGECARMLEREIVRVLDKTVSDNRLVNVEWPGAGKYQTLASSQATDGAGGRTSSMSGN